MGKNQSASNLTNIIQQDANGGIAFMSGSTMLMALSNTGQMSGSVPVLAAATASFVANAQSASYVLTAQTASFVQNAQSASYVLTAQTASFVANAQSASNAVSAQTASFVANAQSASNAVTAATASFVALAQSASNAVSAQTASFANTFTVNSTLTAQTLVVQTITSSVDFVTGSTRFGSILGNTHQFTGSVSITGSLTSNNITATGNVFANTTFQNQFHYFYSYAGTGNQQIAVIGSNSSVNGGYLKIINDSAAGGVRGIRLGIHGNGTPPSSGTDVLTIVDSGNVGIGTDTPSFGKLSIVGTDNTTISSTLWGTSAGAGLVASVYNASQTANSVAGIRLITRDSGASVWNIYNISRGGDNGDLAFGNGAGGAGTEKVRILNNGDIGIGTSSPASRFHISGSGANTQTINLQSSLNNANAYIVHTSGNKSYVTGLSGDQSNSYIIYDNTASTTRLSIASGGDATFSGNLAINNTLSSPGNLIETAGLNVYLRPASGYKVFVDTGDGLNVSSGITNLSNLRTSTIYSEYTKNLTGAYSAGNYYEIVNSSQMVSGVYILKAYIDTYAIGGGTYFITYVSVPFFFYTGGTNNTGAQTFPTMLGSGHAGYNPPIIRLRLSSGSGDGKTYLEFDPNASWSNLTGGGGATVTFYVKRLGD